MTETETPSESTEGKTMRKIGEEDTYRISFLPTLSDLDDRSLANENAVNVLENKVSCLEYHHGVKYAERLFTKSIEQIDFLRETVQGAIHSVIAVSFVLILGLIVMVYTLSKSNDDLQEQIHENDQQIMQLEERLRSIEGSALK